jgi:hypothetical protein
MTVKNRQDGIVLKFNLIVMLWSKLGLGELDV